MRVDRVIETCLYVSDLAEAKAFYQTILGLEPFAEQAGRHVFFRCARGVFLLFNPERSAKLEGVAPAHGSVGPGHVAFAMPESQVGAWREQLQSHGIAIEAEVTWPGGGKSLYFRDPGGNSVELTTPSTWGLE